MPGAKSITISPSRLQKKTSLPVPFTAIINILNMHYCKTCIIEVTLRDVSNSKIVSLEHNKPLLNQVNYVLLHLHLAGKHYAKPSHEELKDWLRGGQVDVLRMGAK